MSSPTAQTDPGEHGRGECVDPPLLRALASPDTYGVGCPVEVHETHASWVFVAGERAYKVKKPLALGFLDYGTLALRRAACAEEVRVNRELAPGIYLGVRAIVRTPTGFALAPEHAAEAIEYAVEMRSFRERDTLAGLIGAGSLEPHHLDAVARRLAAFHRMAPIVAGGGAREILAVWHANLRELADAGRTVGWHVESGQVLRLEAFARAFTRAHQHEIGERRRAGLVRDGHGDLRCEHVLMVPTVRVVDRIEFDPRLRRTDIACDLAFLAMDLEASGQRWAAKSLIDAYRADGMDPGSDALLAFYAAHRALVRTKVALIVAAGAEGEGRARRLEQAQALWDLGERLCWRARAPVAVVVCGPAASGKSTLAAELARRSGLPVVSSDSVRKSLAGLAATERGAPEHYSEQFTHATYDRLGREARRALRRQPGVIVDATCRSRGDRFLLLHRLHGADLTRLVVCCEVTLEVALERAARRMRDAERVSDATPEIVAEQYLSFQALEELPPQSVLRLDAARPLQEQVAEVARAVDLRLARRDSPTAQPQARAMAGHAQGACR